MRTRSRASCLAHLSLVLAACATGCQTFQPSTPLTVRVRDAETQAPVPAAIVRVWRFGSHSEERDQTITAGADGIAHTRLAPPDEGGVMVEVTAPNHLPTQTTLPHDVVDALASTKRFHPYTGPPLEVTIDVFAGPRPTAELVLPVGFRGTIKAEIRVRADGSWPAGQRAFSYTVPENGVVRVEGPAVFGLGSGPDIVAKFADGTPLPKEAKNEEIALRWVRREGTDVSFVVGTSADLDAIRRTLGGGESERSQRASPSGQGGGRRGGGGGRGGGRMGR
ncbi:unnamed protein product [Gemmata massiliana]|uniref:Lipoprotein n=1 Tax=Gemmata massiliana TaxID=1210884 RepID=A0A6P2DJ32_9BACT|nr:hypothetical protein [Gemmata massiliana]VTS02688.1 unnamed protein product [Gemmata massiliana]